MEEKEREEKEREKKEREEEKREKEKREALIPPCPYVTHIPENLQLSEHFSSLMLSFDPLATTLEVSSLTLLTLVAWIYGIRVEGSKSLLEVAAAMWGFSMLRRLYNNYLEAVFCAFPQNRTQSVKEHKLKCVKDLVGRDKDQLAAIAVQDRLTFATQFCLDLFVYFMIPGFYPAEVSSCCFSSLPRRIAQLVLNHYVMSFGMYWSHRALHKNAWLWNNIHSLHHWAKHPLSRTTYQDHWLDNFGNAIVGHIFAQILVPLDGHMFWVSRVFRVCESLEKHSGVSGYFNLAHSVQRWVPFAQMPHHHDWHHEGHKGCNYTFTSIGGLWDCLFGTRKTGRSIQSVETTHDKHQKETSKGVCCLDTAYFDGQYTCFLPLVALTGLVIKVL